MTVHSQVQLYTVLRMREFALRYRIQLYTRTRQLSSRLYTDSYRIGIQSTVLTVALYTVTDSFAHHRANAQHKLCSMADGTCTRLDFEVSRLRTACTKPARSGGCVDLQASRADAEGTLPLGPTTRSTEYACMARRGDWRMGCVLLTSRGRRQHWRDCWPPHAPRHLESAGRHD